MRNAGEADAAARDTLTSMGRLVPFQPPPRPARKPLGPPPADALERASWLHNLLCNELYDALSDGTLTPEQRRDLVLRFGGKITQAMPHHEIAAARDEVRGDEAEVGGAGLGGEVTRATGAEPRPIRAAGPRGRSR